MRRTVDDDEESLTLEFWTNQADLQVPYSLKMEIDSSGIWKSSCRLLQVGWIVGTGNGFVMLVVQLGF